MKFTNTIIYNGQPQQNLKLMQTYLTEFDGHKTQDFGLDGCYLNAVMISAKSGNICLTSYDCVIDQIENGNYVQITGYEIDLLINDIKKYKINDSEINDVYSELAKDEVVDVDVADRIIQGKQTKMYYRVVQLSLGPDTEYYADRVLNIKLEAVNQKTLKGNNNYCMYNCTRKQFNSVYNWIRGEEINEMNIDRMKSTKPLTRDELEQYLNNKEQ